MEISKYKPMYSSVETFITRFFVGIDLIFEQETKVPLPTLCIGDNIEIFNSEYIVKKKIFGFNEDVFMTVYNMEPRVLK